MIYKTISSPFNILIVFFIVIVLYLLRLSTQISVPDFRTAFYLLICLFFMALGIICGSQLKFTGRSKPVPFIPSLSPVRQRLFVLLLLIVSTLFFLFEHLVFIRKYGTFPVFNPEFEVLRMNFPVSGYVHIIAMAGFVLLLSLYYDYMIYKKTWAFYQKILFISLLLTNLTFSFLVGNRGEIAIFFAQCFIISYSFKKVKWYKIFFMALLGLYALGLAKFVRDYFYFGPSIIDRVAEIWYFGGVVILLPFYYCYVTFVMNFEVLNRYITSIDAFHYGYFSLWLPFESLINKSAYDLIDLQNDVLNDSFYGVLTATGFGIPYFDFGYFGFILIFLLAFVLGFVFYITYTCGKIYYIPFYAYYMTGFLTLIYTYNFNKLYVWIYLVVLFFIARLYKEKIL